MHWSTLDIQLKQKFLLQKLHLILSKSEAHFKQKNCSQFPHFFVQFIQIFLSHKLHLVKHFLQILDSHKWQFIEQSLHIEFSQIWHFIKFSLFFEEMHLLHMLLLHKEQFLEHLSQFKF